MHEEKLEWVACDDSSAYGCRVSQIPEDSSEQANGSESWRTIPKQMLSEEIGEKEVVSELLDSIQPAKEVSCKLNEGSAKRKNLRMSKFVSDGSKFDRESLKHERKPEDHSNTMLSKPDKSNPPEPHPMQIDENLGPLHLGNGSGKELEKRIEADFGSAMDWETNDSEGESLELLPNKGLSNEKMSSTYHIKQRNSCNLTDED